MDGGRATCSWLTFRLTFWQIRILAKYSIKEESKVAKSDWVDHQAYSLLQYINIIAYLFIMGYYFNELR